MSPRAACRLDRLGFTDVYDYAPGKVDWLAHNLPTQGPLADALTAGKRLRTDVVTAGPEEPVGSVRARVEASRYGFALVVTSDRTLLGRLRGTGLGGDPTVTAEQAMEPGPVTIRPHEPLDLVAARMRDHNLTTSLVTDPEGHLLGVVHRDDLAS
jgi:CBS domain-containing protein